MIDYLLIANFFLLFYVILVFSLQLLFPSITTQKALSLICVQYKVNPRFSIVEETE